MKPGISLLSNEYAVLEDQTILEKAKEIANNAAQEDPFYILDVGDIVHKVKNWKLLLPRVKPFYAMKCNDDTTVLEILAALGIGFDCASKVEMRKIIDMGVSSNRIIFAHPCKPSSHIRSAAKMGVKLMTFDNEAELHKLKFIMPDASLVIRIRCDAAKAQCPLGIKFGVLPEDAHILLDVAKDLGLDIAGVSFHVGSGCQEPEVFLRAIESARQVFDEAVAKGFNPYLLDIGGGFPGHKGSSLDEIAYYVNMALDLHFPESMEVEVIAEPGRYMVASAFTLFTQVVSKRTTNTGKAGCMYYVNDGVYGSFNCVLYDHQEVSPYTLETASLEKPLLPSSIWGPTCDALDKVVDNVFLPPLDLGDWLGWDNMGAYTIVAAGTFNGFPIAEVHNVMKNHTYSFLHNLKENRLTHEVLAESGDICDIHCCLSDARLIKMLDTLAIDEANFIDVASADI